MRKEKKKINRNVLELDVMLRYKIRYKTTKKSVWMKNLIIFFLFQGNGKEKFSLNKIVYSKHAMV